MMLLYDKNKSPKPAMLNKHKNLIHEAERSILSRSYYDVGTGKSEVGARLVYIFAVENYGKGSVLYCSPSNKAVDVVRSKKQFTYQKFEEIES